MKIILPVLLFISSLFAELHTGMAFPNLHLVDQFGKVQHIQTKGNVKVILSFDKPSSLAVNTFLQRQKKDFLTHNHINYISNISQVPSFIRDWVALPKMKNLPFEILLIYDEHISKKLNYEEGKVTVFTLKNNIITTINFIAPEALNKILH